MRDEFLDDRRLHHDAAIQRIVITRVSPAVNDDKYERRQPSFPDGRVNPTQQALGNGEAVRFLSAAPSWQPVYDGIERRGGSIVRRQVNAVPYFAIHRGAVISVVCGQGVNFFRGVRPPADFQNIKGTARRGLCSGR